MRRFYLLWIVLPALFGCSDQDYIARADEKIRSSKAKWAAVSQQEADIQACREHGGIPVTKPSDLTYYSDFKFQLVRCEFPCDKRFQLEAR